MDHSNISLLVRLDSHEILWYHIHWFLQLYQRYILEYHRKNHEDLYSIAFFIGMLHSKSSVRPLFFLGSQEVLNCMQILQLMIEYCKDEWIHLQWQHLWVQLETLDYLAVNLKSFPLLLAHIFRHNFHQKLSNLGRGLYLTC